MQITEVSVMGVRWAVIDLRHPNNALKFRLFPMVHFGKPTFHRPVATRLRVCAVIVAEGDDGASSMGLACLEPMRVTGHGRARALMHQYIDYQAFGIPTVRPGGPPSVSVS